MSAALLKATTALSCKAIRETLRTFALFKRQMLWTISPPLSLHLLVRLLSTCSSEVSSRVLRRTHGPWSQAEQRTTHQVLVRAILGLWTGRWSIFFLLLLCNNLETSLFSSVRFYFGGNWNHVNGCNLVRSIPKTVSYVLIGDEVAGTWNSGGSGNKEPSEALLLINISTAGWHCT